MASIMSKAVVGSVIALIFYILSFMPYMFVFTSGMNSSFWPILVTVSSNLMIFFSKTAVIRNRIFILVFLSESIDDILL